MSCAIRRANLLSASSGWVRIVQRSIVAGCAKWSRPMSVNKSDQEIMETFSIAQLWSRPKSAFESATARIAIELQGTGARLIRKRTTARGVCCRPASWIEAGSADLAKRDRPPPVALKVGDKLLAAQWLTAYCIVGSLGVLRERTGINSHWGNGGAGEQGVGAVACGKRAPADRCDRCTCRYSRSLPASVSQ
jgi:hypothetical protein